MNTGRRPTAVPGYDNNEWVIHDPGSDELAEEFDEALELSYAGRHQESMRRLVEVLNKHPWHIDALHPGWIDEAATDRRAVEEWIPLAARGPTARRGSGCSRGVSPPLASSLLPRCADGRSVRRLRRRGEADSPTERGHRLARSEVWSRAIMKNDPSN